MITSTPPSFLTTDQATVTEAVISEMETALGKTLYPSQLERLLADCMAYREALLRLAIQSAATENLIDFATGSRLEGLGRLLGVTRIAAQAATTTWAITLPATSTSSTLIAAGYTATDDSGLAWVTTADLTIPAGSLSGIVAAQCATPGTAPNEIPSGTVFSGTAGDYTITSTTASSGGADEETDTALRVRILAAPFAFSSAGPAKAYYYHTLTVDSTIVDCAVSNGGPGIVNIYPLTSTGLPSEVLRAAIAEALSADTIRPLCDTVQVINPTEVTYTLSANITLYDTVVESTVMASCVAAAEAYVAGRAAGMGRDLIASQAVKAIQAVEGVYKVELVGWADRVLASNEWAHGSVALTLAGTVHG